MDKTYATSQIHFHSWCWRREEELSFSQWEGGGSSKKNEKLKSFDYGFLRQNKLKLLTYSPFSSLSRFRRELGEKKSYVREVKSPGNINGLYILI